MAADAELNNQNYLSALKAKDQEINELKQDNQKKAAKLLAVPKIVCNCQCSACTKCQHK